MSRRCRARLLIAASALLPVATAAPAQESFEDWQQSQEQAFQGYRTAQDRQFQNFLEKQWEDFQGWQGKPEDPAPKPDTMPTAPEQPRDAPRGELPEPNVVPTPSGADDVPDKPAPEAPDPQKVEGRRIEFGLLGHDVAVTVPRAWDDLAVKGVDKSAIAPFWKAFAQTSAKPVVAQLRARQDKLRLSDWGYLRMARRLAGKVAPDTQTARPLTWAILVKSGLKVRLAYTDGSYFVLYAAQGEVFDTRYFKFDDTRFYLFGVERALEQVTSYPTNHASADRALNLVPEAMPRAQGDVVRRKLDFAFQGQSYTVSVPIAEKLVAHLATLPQLNVARYFQADPTPRMEEALVAKLEAAVADKPLREQINLLLRFVQTAFTYKTDSAQFNAENYLFPVETAYYPASDCEDRAVLFAWVVRNVLDLRIAALDYPGHVATAIDAPVQIDRGRVPIGGDSLYVADPTYIEADLGMVMPKYRDDRPTVIPLWQRG